MHMSCSHAQLWLHIIVARTVASALLYSRHLHGCASAVAHPPDLPLGPAPIAARVLIAEPIWVTAWLRSWSRVRSDRGR